MKNLILFSIILFLFSPMPACSNDNNSLQEVPTTPNLPDNTPPISALKLKITAGNTVLYATLYDNETTRSFIEILPLTLTAFDRIGLVKSNLLPKQISDAGERTRKYEKGAVFYWHEGPEIAFCYSDHLPQTVVDIIHIGKIEDGIELFQTYTGKLLVELVESNKNIQ